MNGQTDPWGPYRSSVDERLASCEDFLGRLSRSIDGVIAPDRHYFGEKARALRGAAQSLVDHVDDVEWWLGSCDHLTERADPTTGLTELVECGRAAGHEGAHRDDRECPEQRVLAEARAGADELRAVTDRLAWGLLTLRADAGVADAGSLASELRGVLARLAATASAVERLRDCEPAGGGSR